MNLRVPTDCTAGFVTSALSADGAFNRMLDFTTAQARYSREQEIIRRSRIHPPVSTMENIPSWVAGIVNELAVDWGVSPENILGPSTDRIVCEARHKAMLKVRQDRDHGGVPTFRQIGLWFNRGPGVTQQVLAKIGGNDDDRKPFSRVDMPVR